MAATLDRNNLVNLIYATHCVNGAANWGLQMGLEFWAHFGEDAVGVTTEGGLLSAHGWTVTGAPPDAAASGADFLSSADKGTTGGVNLDTASDVIQSPAIFGAYVHAKAAALKAGMDDLPSFLVCDFGARFAANAAETGTGIGFVEDGGSAAVAADHMAAIATDGTNWILRSGAATSDALAVDDTNWHHFRIVVDNIASEARAYIDDMSADLGSIAIQADEWPVSWGGGVVSAGTNDPVISWVRVRYAWRQFGI